MYPLNGEADQLRNSRLLNAWWAAQEADAVDLIRAAKPEDDEKRRWHSQRLQVIEMMRDDLARYAQGTAPAPHMAGE